MKLFLSVLLVASGLLAGCAQTPSKLSGEFAAIDPAQVDGNNLSGVHVRWGGVMMGARLANDQSCVEIAAFPVDDLTGKPYDAHANAGDGFALLFATGQHKANPTRHGAYSREPLKPRFLACSVAGDPLFDAPLGAVVTVVGRLQSSLVFNVAENECLQSKWTFSDYAGNAPTLRADDCVVSVPALTLESAVVWKEPPSKNSYLPPSGFAIR